MEYDVTDFQDAQSIQKNSYEEIRVFAHEFQGTRLISARIFNRRGIPSYKGLTLRPETWKEVLPILEKLLVDDKEDGDDL